MLRQLMQSLFGFPEQAHLVMPHLIILLIMDFHNGLWMGLTDPPQLKVDGSEVQPRACWCVQAGRVTRVSSQGRLSPTSLPSLDTWSSSACEGSPSGQGSVPSFHGSA